MSVALYLLMLLLPVSGGKARARDAEGHGESHRSTIVINYVIDQYDRHFYLSQPQVEYLKIPEFPLPSHIPLGARGYDVLLRVTTDGQNVTAVDTIGKFVGIADLPDCTKDLAEAHGIAISEPSLRGLAEAAKENVWTWRFRKHEPREFSTTWRFVLGEIIDDNDGAVDGLDDVLDADTMTLNAPQEVEVVVFPKLACELGRATASPKSPLQVECLKIPEHPRQLRPGFKQDVTMRVKTDGRNVASVEVIGGTTNQTYRTSSIEYVKTWTFKEHEPTEFVTRWKYDYETAFEPKPNIVTLNLPYDVEVKSFHVIAGDPVLRRKRMRRSQK
jgi:hypothetical protein